MGVLKVEDNSGVRLVTFDRPEALNAFTNELYAAAQRALAEAAGQKETAVVVLTGAGRAFCAGQDLGQMGAAAEGTADGDSEMPHGFSGFMDTLMEFPKPLIGSVNGLGVGLGLTLLGHCDLVLMADDARLRGPFTSLGVVPEAGSSVLLPSIMGWQRAAHFLFTSEWIDADEALACGLAWKICPKDALLDETMVVARKIAEMPVGSLVATKRLLLAGRKDSVRAARDREDIEFRRLVGGPANREAIAAFMEKRQADFSGIDSY